ncbi:hypothetical protein D3C77_323910 [compost metagenome]
MHPAGGQQLSHGGVDDRNTGAAFLPGFQLVGCVAPGECLGFLAEGAVARHPRVAVEDVLVELTPDQLVDPGHQPAVATVKLAVVVPQGTQQALARGDDARCEIRRELAGAGNGGKVPLQLVVINGFIDKALQAVMGFGFTGRPEIAQAGRWHGETRHLSGDRVVGNR